MKSNLLLCTSFVSYIIEAKFIFSKQSGDYKVAPEDIRDKYPGVYNDLPNEHVSKPSSGSTGGGGNNIVVIAGGSAGSASANPSGSF